MCNAGALAHLRAFLEAFHQIVSPGTADGHQNHMLNAVLEYSLLKQHFVCCETRKTFLVLELKY